MVIQWMKCRLALGLSLLLATAGTASGYNHLPQLHNHPITIKKATGLQKSETHGSCSATDPPTVEEVSSGATTEAPG